MSNTPIVSIVLPVYNAEKFVCKTVESLLKQSFTDFELIIVNDGSTDKSLQVINEFTDIRIVIYDKPKNSGIVDTLNIGISLAKGKYIARMDADDIAHPERLMIQYDYLVNNPEIAVVGTYAETFGYEKNTLKYYEENDLIKTGLIFNNQLCHPSLMINKSLIADEDLIYKKEFQLAEDWILWFDLTRKGYKFCNLPNILLNYRIEGQNSTEKNRRTEKDRHFVVYKYILETIGIQATAEMINLHWMLARGDIKIEKLQDVTKYTKYLFDFLKQSAYPIDSLETIIREKKDKLFYRISGLSKRKALLFSIKHNIFSFSKLKYLIAKKNSK